MNTGLLKSRKVIWTIAFLVPLGSIVLVYFYWRKVYSLAVGGIQAAQGALGMTPLGTDELQGLSPGEEYFSFMARAGAEYGVSPTLIWVIGNQETRWGGVTGSGGTTGPSIIGEDTHGRGLMQIDDRYWTLDNWQDPLTNIRQGAYIIRTYADQLRDGGIPEDQIINATVAAYNGGVEKVLNNFKNGVALGTGTTKNASGDNYDVSALNMLPNSYQGNLNVA